MSQEPVVTRPNSCHMNGYTPIMDQFGFPAWQNLSGNRSIRIDQEIPDQISALTTKEQVWERIQKVRSIQDKYGASKLLSRTWISTKSTTSLSEQQRIHTFSVAQFNALAEGLSAGPHVTTPFLACSDNDDALPNSSNNNKQREDDVGTFGGFTSIPHPDIVLDFSLRKWRLLEVLLTSDTGNTTTKPCDILAMEEIDRYHGFFAPMLRLFGYQGAFVPKRKSPGVSMGWYSDGCALFWNNQVFELISQRHHGYSLGNQVALHVILRHRVTSKSLVVIVTHLKSKCNAVNENIRTKQIQELLIQVEETVQTVVSRDDDFNKMPVLILGDFNTETPATSPLPDSSLNQIIMGTSFKSLYPVDSSMLYTTWKTRGSVTVKRVIDYIFYRGSLDPVARLGVPEERELEPTKLPGLRYPSDHVLIAGRFHLN